MFCICYLSVHNVPEVAFKLETFLNIWLFLHSLVSLILQVHGIVTAENQVLSYLF